MAERRGLRNVYDELRPQYEKLEEEVRLIVSAAINRSGKRVHSVTSRVKEIESAFNKLENTGLLDAVDTDSAVFEKLEDMVGVRVVALFRDDLVSIVD